MEKNQYNIIYYNDYYQIIIPPPSNRNFFLINYQLFLSLSIQQLKIDIQLEISQYKLLSLLGSGSKHLVYKIELYLTCQEFAIKLERSSQLGQISNEIEILKQLTNIEGIPKLIQYGVTKENRKYLIIPLFHSSLKDLIKQKRLSQSTILNIGLRIIEILEKVHKNNILHLDIKPENIMISQSIQNDQDFLKPGFIQLIDFGLSQKFQENSESLQDIFIGSLNFASRSSHTGSPLGYKDDLESLLYLLYYLKDSKLPWSEKGQYGLNEIDLDQIGDQKITFFTNNLHSYHPCNIFSSFMSYVDKLRNNVMPDYDYIKEIFEQMIKGSYIKQLPTNKVKLRSLYNLDQRLNVDSKIIKICQSNNSEEINLDNLSEKKIILVSSLICNYKTNTIKSIKDLEQKM